EHVAHAARADADKHLHEVGTADAKERHIRLTGDRPGQQRLASARRADHQHALRNASAKLLEFLGILEELHQLRNLLLGFLDSSNILKSDLVLVARHHLRLALAKIERALAGHADLLAK